MRLKSILTLRLLGFIVAPLACSPLAAHADQPYTWMEGTPKGLELGITGSQSTYTEGGIGMQLHSLSGGWLAGYTLPMADGAWIKLDYRGSYTNKGKYKQPSSGFHNSETNILNDGRLLLGTDLMLGSYQETTLAPYVGIGYRRYTNDGRGDTTAGDAGYRRQNDTFYVPLGLNIYRPFDLPMELGLEYDTMIEGQQKSFFSDAALGERDITNDQDKGASLKAHMGLDLGSWQTGVFYDMWRVDDSNSVRGNTSTWMEPKNRTTEVGVYLKTRFNAPHD